MVQSILGVPLELPGTFGRPSLPEHRAFGSLWFALIERLLRKGSIRNHPIDIREGGLAGIPANLEDFRVGNVRAKKLVVPLLT
jgi:aspyridone synthetase trans-acting enoyl reductase